MLRCWPFARFDWRRVQQWLNDNGVEEWLRESDLDLEKPLRVILKAVERGELTAKRAEEILEGLDLI